MDTITHGLAGWLAGRAIPFPDEQARKVGTAAVVAGAVLPDADNVASLFGSEIYLKIHRGISHSLFAIPVISFLLALLFYKLGRWKELKRLFLLTFLGQLSHVALDLLNSYGTQIFQPFSDARVSFDVLFIVDLLFTGIIVAGIALSRRKPARARAALGVLAAYVALAAGLHLRAEGIVREAALENRIPVKASYALPRMETIPIPDRLDLGWGRRAEAAAPDAGAGGGSHALPEAPPRTFPFPGGPFAWNGFIDDGGTYTRAEVSPLSGTVEWKQRVTRGQDVPEVRALQRLPDVRTWLWFARFPTVAVTSGNGRTVLIFSDLRFGGIPGRYPFRLKVIESLGRSPRVEWGS